MKKHIALVLGTIFSLTILFVPFTGAFASSDTSVALPQFVFSLMFSSVSVGSFIDVTNYNAATGTSSTDNSVHLYNTAGSYSQINRQGINVAQNLLCLRYTIDNPSSGFFDDLVIEPYINGSPAHLYGTYTQSDNNNSITYYMFFYIGADTIRVKDSQGQDITPWGIRFTRTHDISYSWSFSSSGTSLYYYNYTLQSQTVDPGEAAELALDIINVLQLSQLSENLGMINTQLDTGNIASMMESMLSYLAQIPDIITLLSSINTTDSSILSAVHTFLTYYSNMFHDRNFVALNPSVYDNNGNPATNSQAVYDGYYVVDFDNRFRDNFLQIQLEFYSNKPNSKFTIDYFFVNDLSMIFDNRTIHIPAPYEIVNLRTSYVKLIFDVLPYQYTYQMKYLVFHIHSDEGYIALYPQYSDLAEYYSYIAVPYKYSFFDRILYYLKNLTFGNNRPPTEIQQTSDAINTDANTVNNFQSSTQQSLDQNLNDVPVVDYQIQATTGTQYMKAYSEALFNASNGFRIWYMLPLILFVIGMLIRWGVKK